MILITLEVLVFCLEAWAYDLADCLGLVAGLLLLKYFEITLTSFWDLARMSREILSMFARADLLISLLFLLGEGTILGVNLAAIFLLSEFDCLSA